ncbi:hypothetical protein Srot_2465 [Segniliparus rotundus DSM 44985]|uniref:Uncharacterized protein n=1 Tax=Segniliparus rotundus (strain ATCC BAA-972 / CDC 1076 / CIP 108378 / DSM 44985 / JCM 13578) TaxID=640132 RepID=D6ZBF3_SEGRD|nr:hypothetical protein Srot_2465 [Segniliparus rotundus DSM 44985]
MLGEGLQRAPVAVNRFEMVSDRFNTSCRFQFGFERGKGLDGPLDDSARPNIGWTYAQHIGVLCAAPGRVVELARSGAAQSEDIQSLRVVLVPPVIETPGFRQSARKLVERVPVPLVRVGHSVAEAPQRGDEIRQEPSRARR